MFSNDLFSLKYALDGYVHDIVVKKTSAKSNRSNENRIALVILSCQYVLLLMLQ